MSGRRNPAAGVFYGWKLVGAMSVVLFFTGGGGLYVFPVFISSFQEEFGWSMTQISISGALFAIVMGLSNPLVGVLFARFGARRTMLVAGALTALTSLCYAALQNLVTRIEQKITLFDRLREAMRIARPDCAQGLNDDGDGEIKTIESRVKAFRYSKTIKALSASDISYQKMAKQIDKYWDKLFADPIAVNTPAGTVMIQPQRTNNLMEQSFRFLKRDGRKKTGQKALSRTLVAMLADTPLVRNLDNPDYMRILLNGKATLAARFADIDIQQVREEEQANNNRFRKYPKNMHRLFRVPHLPRKIMKAASM